MCSKVLNRSHELRLSVSYYFGIVCDSVVLFVYLYYLIRSHWCWRCEDNVRLDL